MTEDDRIAELFHAAASETGAPPPGFDHRDVVAVSRRITARRRSAVVGGAVALLFVAGVGTVAVLPRSDSSTMTTASAGANGDNAAAAPRAAAPEAAVGGADSGGAAAGGQGGSAESDGGAAGGGGVAPGGTAPGGTGGGTDGVVPGGPGSNGVAPGGSAGGTGGVAPGGGAGSGGALPPGGGAGQPAPAVPAPGAGTPAHPLGPGSGICANRQDPALKALVAAVLPEAANAPGAATSDICLPAAQRYLSVELGGGVLTVGYLPPGTVASLAPGASSAATASHGTVIVSPPPGYTAQAPKLLAYLAPRL